MFKVILVSLSLVSCAMPTAPANTQGEVEKKPKKKAAPTVAVATLGIETAAPAEELAKERGLKLDVRIRGQEVTEVEKASPAAKAGVKVGDILVQIDDNEIFSQDDIADFLAVSEPKRKVTLHVVRAKKKKPSSLHAVLGSKRVKALSKPKMAWQFASLGQLDDAMAKAKKEHRLVLIGLSGAET